MSKVWFVTGANSGIGAGIAKAALKAGDRVVATARNLDKLRNALHDAWVVPVTSHLVLPNSCCAQHYPYISTRLV